MKKKNLVAILVAAFFQQPTFLYCPAEEKKPEILIQPQTPLGLVILFLDNLQQLCNLMCTMLRRPIALRGQPNVGPQMRNMCAAARVAGGFCRRHLLEFILCFRARGITFVTKNCLYPLELWPLFEALQVVALDDVRREAFMASADGILQRCVDESGCFRDAFFRTFAAMIYACTGRRCATDLS
jgi:hypothetical protein